MIAAVTFDFWETLVHDTPENLERGRAMRLEATAGIALERRPAQPLRGPVRLFARNATRSVNRSGCLHRGPALE